MRERMFDSSFMYRDYESRLKEVSVLKERNKKLNKKLKELRKEIKELKAQKGA